MASAAHAVYLWGAVNDPFANPIDGMIALTSLADNDFHQYNCLKMHLTS